MTDPLQGAVLSPYPHSPGTSEVQRMADFGTLSPKWEVSNKPLPPGLRELCRGGARENEVPKETDLQDKTGHTCELTDCAAGTGRSQTGQVLRAEGVGPSLTQELPATGYC